MKKQLIPLAVVLSTGAIHAQVGVGTLNPHKSAQLEVVADNKGILIPRIALNSITDQETMMNGNVQSLLVFNTTSNEEIKPGYYYWFETKWQRLVTLSDINMLIEGLEDTNTKNVSLTVQNGNLTLTDSDGQMVEVPLTSLQNPETVTTLVNNENGTYTYTSENGTVTTINVPADVVNNFEEIISNQTVLNQLIQHLQNTVVGGNVFYDGEQFTYIDNSGQTQVINFEQIVKANETVTTLVNNENGTYTYTSENGTVTTINVPADVVNNFEEIISNQTVLNQLILHLQNTVVGGNVFYDGEQFTYIDNSGQTQVINFEQIVKANETITTLVNNENGTYTYTSENGTTTLIDVPNDVINNFQTITSNATVIDVLETIVRNTKTNVLFNGSEFTYVNNNGDTVVIDLGDIIQSNQKTYGVSAGSNVTVTEATVGNFTDFTVSVATAKGADGTTPATLGVVKEAAENPTVLINTNGELFVDKNQLNNIKEVTQNYAVTDEDMVVLANADSATLLITLPDAAGKKGKKLTIKKSDAKNTTYVNVMVTGGAAIDGQPDLYTSLPYSGWDLMSDGTEWRIIKKF